MRVDVQKKNPALESVFAAPEQTIFLDANFFIPPDRSVMGTKPIPFLKFCEIVFLVYYVLIIVMIV